MEIYFSKGILLSLSYFHNLLLLHDHIREYEGYYESEAYKILSHFKVHTLFIGI